MKPNYRDYFCRLLIVFLLTGFAATAKAQELSADTLAARIENIKSSVDILNRLKVTGYIQAQWQKSDTIGGAAAFSGGNFPAYSDNRFMIRRGRLKFTYDYEMAQFVIQTDVTEKGFALKDAYVAVKEPWAQFATLTAGVFNRPFGYEISYSSSSRETPERARIFQSIFPGERDLGAMLTLSPKKGSRYDWIKLDAGLFCGNAIGPEIDKHKDFIGHLYFAKANNQQTFKYGAGFSYYNGAVFQGTKFVYNPGTLSDGFQGFLVDSTSSNKTRFAKRDYYGVDLQLGMESGIGLSSIRAEYLWGKQPGSKTSNTSLSNAALPNYDSYVRSMNGGYVYFIQNIGQTKNQLVVKYDWYDPNTKVSGNEIIAKNSAGKVTGLGSADIKYSTVGIGWNYRFNSVMKFTAYYEFVKNEATKIAGYTKDLKDNVLTLRVQYKF
jgi:phosphate-selective porin